MTKRVYKQRKPSHAAHTKLQPHKHTGKVLPHRHTSYGSLAIVLLFALVPMVTASRTVAYAATSGEAQYGTYAVVPGTAPSEAPTINTPNSGADYTTADPVTVAGSCPNNTMVRVYKNEVLAGANLCQGGRYNLPIALFIGDNTLVARAYTASELVSPDSSPVSVRLALPLRQLAPAYDQFYITGNVLYRGSEVGNAMSWDLTASGGQSPYAISVSWGDGESDVISQGTAGTFTVTHTYHKASPNGGYTIIARGVDQQGNKAFFRFAGIVSGGTAIGVASGVSKGYSSSIVIRILWQLFAVSVVVVLAFWIGERRELMLLRHGKVRI